jgi:predicted SAM-dependent methyltransferase
MADGYSKALKKVVKPDIEADVRKLPLPDNYADEIRAVHVIEHLWAWEALDAVMEWVRVLKPGCQLAIECPCLEKVMQLFQVPQVEPRYTYWALYGDPRHHRPEMMHRWCYSTMALTRLMAQAGLEDLHAERPQFHFPVRDMRVVGKKPQSSLIVPVTQ